MNNFTITADQIAEVLPVFYNAKRVPLFVGSPGTAKTAFVHEAAAEMTRSLGETVHVRELHLASMSEVDIRGYLIPDGDRAVFTKPEFWAEVEKYPRGIVFIDEFPQASHEAQKAVAPFILEGRIGENVLPPGWMVALAGNGIDDGAGANTLLSHIINRISIIRVKAPDVDTWASWAVKTGLPYEVIAFAKFRPEVVFSGEVPDSADTPYCTARSLHICADLASNFPGGIKAMVESRVGHAMGAGAIGEGAWAELCGLVRTAMTLPSYESVIAAPDKAVVPDKPDAAYAMVMLMAVRAKPEHAGAVVEYLSRFKPNMAITGIVSLVRRDKSMAACKQMLTWVNDNKDLLRKFSKYITEAL